MAPVLFPSHLSEKYMLKKFTLAAVAALVLSTSAFAQQASQGQNSTVSGQSTASIAQGAVSVNSYGAAQLPWTTIDQNFHTNQAASAPANIGSTSSGSNTGCPAVDGWSASVVVANGGKTTAKELPGCMLNILGQNIGMLKEIEVNGVRQFDGISVMRLETWCLYDLYKQAIENGMSFKCKATRDAEAEQKRQAALASTVYPANSTVSSDPYIAARQSR